MLRPVNPRLSIPQAGFSQSVKTVQLCLDKQAEANVSKLVHMRKTLAHLSIYLSMSIHTDARSRHWKTTPLARRKAQNFGEEGSKWAPFCRQKIKLVQPGEVVKQMCVLFWCVHQWSRGLPARKNCGLLMMSLDSFVEEVGYLPQSPMCFSPTNTKSKLF
jgi:hypothetical protein